MFDPRGVTKSMLLRAARRSLSTAAKPARVTALRQRLANEAAELDDFVGPGGEPSASPAGRRQRRQRLPEDTAAVAAARAPAPALFDRFERGHTYLRMSLTERCSLRCVYCMPSDGVQLTPAGRLLTADETLRLARLFVRAGVDKIRLTGGEPTVRRDLPEIVAALDGLRPDGLRTIALTSNGIALPRMLPSLVEAGLDKLNLSLDTLDAGRFAALTRRDGLPRVLAAIDLALELGLEPLKLNCVLMAGRNDDELGAFAALASERPIDVRFIEYMPFDGNAWQSDTVVPLERIVSELRRAYPAMEKLPTPKNDVAVSWRLHPEARGSVSVIASMTQPFCAGCNRLRLTADGNLKVCLFGSAEVSLRDAMREGATDAELLELVGGALSRKHARHAGIASPELIAASANRPMTTIGG
jgi:molybdenum cofactor biosynthesis protein A